MGIILFFTPLFVITAAVFLYRHNGKKEILKFDLVQFVYSFVLSPLFYIWSKSFIFYLIRDEVKLTENEIFIIDTSYSVFFMFVYASIVIHSLTKSFELKITKDPLYDIFTHSEFFHKWASHLIFQIGAMVIFTAVSVLNVFFPLELFIPKILFYFLLLIAVVIGIISFISIWLTKEIGDKYLKVMKLGFSFFFLIHLLVYFIKSPRFYSRYLIYWFIFTVFLVCVFLSAFINKMNKSQKIFDLFHYKKK